jgi:tetratricopeptide (TPR) repeat protein
VKLSAAIWLLLCFACLFPNVRQTAFAQSEARLKAFQLEQEGQNAEAEEVWRSILTTHPRNAEALAHVGLLEARREHYDDAIAYYRKALLIEPAYPGLRLDLGLAFFKAGRFQEAAQCFQSELRKKPGDQRLTILLGMAYYGVKNYAAAIPYLKQAAASDPQNLPLRLDLAHSCLWARQFPCVLSVYKQILTLNDESAEADMLAGEAMDAMGNSIGAIEQFRAAERVNPNEPNVHFGLGYLLWTQKQYTEAAREFQGELDNNPQQGQARAYLGDVLIRQNDFAKAEPQLQQAVVEDPSLALTHLDLGIVYANSGRNEDAVQAFQKAIALDPKDVDAHWRLAKLYQAMGRKEEAKAEFDRVGAMKKEQDQDSHRTLLQIR